VEEFAGSERKIDVASARINWAIFAVGIATVLHSIYNVFFAQGLITKPLVHLALTSTIVLLVMLRRKRSLARVLWVVALAAIIYSSLSYIFVVQDTLYIRIGFQPWTQVAFMFTVLAVIFYLSWVMFGPVFAVSASIFMAYVYVGDASWLPDLLRTADTSFKRATATLSFQAVGGQIIELSATFLFMLLAMGALLQSSGGAAFIWSLSRGITRRVSGGAGLVAVVSSSTVATFTGGGAANAGITGVITIPMMKKTGYTPEQAAAIEAVASVAGAVTPPILGTAAFIMADFIGVSYIDIVIATIFPAVLFYMGLATYISLQAKRDNLAASIEEFIPQSSGKQTMVAAAQLVLPMGVLMTLLVNDLSVQLSVLLTIVTILVVWGVVWLLANRGVIQPDPEWKTWRRSLTSAFILASGIAMAAATLDVMLSAITQTGLGLRVASLVVDWGQGILILTLAIGIGLSYVLGLGLPPLPVYVITAVLLAPAMVKLGAPLMVAHYVMFYTGMVFPNINPPVASTVLVTGQMAGANYMKASIEATKYAGGAMYLPFLVFFAPEIMLVGVSVVSPQFWLIFLTVATAIFVGQAGLVGYFGGRMPLLVRATALLAPVSTFAFLYAHEPTEFSTNFMWIFAHFWSLVWFIVSLFTFAVPLAYGFRGVVVRSARTRVETPVS